MTVATVITPTSVVGIVLLLPVLATRARAAPCLTATLWLLSLTVQAVGGLMLAAYAVLVIPVSAPFQSLTSWTLHGHSPHVDLVGHRLGDAVSVLPLLLIIASLAWLAITLARTTRAVRSMVRQEALGPGPRDSVILRGPHVLLAAAGFARPRIVVSAGALAKLDDDELEAGLAHEHAHIRRGHRFVVLYAHLAHALVIPLPGTRRAVDGLLLQLERDADAWAVRRTQNRRALARAICKAALSTPSSPALVALAGSTGTSDRVEELLHDPTRTGPSDRAISVVAVLTTATLAVGLCVLVPALFAGGHPDTALATLRHALGF